MVAHALEQDRSDRWAASRAACFVVSGGRNQALRQQGTQAARPQGIYISQTGLAASEAELRRSAQAKRNRPARTKRGFGGLWTTRASRRHR